MCINQVDVAERDEQVGRMREIYQNARVVFISLHQSGIGPDADHELRTRGEFVARLAKYLSCLAIFNGMDMGVARRVSDKTFELSTTDSRVYDLRYWKQLSSLFKELWFERLWIIQELAVSKSASVLWGTIKIPWSDIEGAAKYILYPGYCPPPNHIKVILPSLGAHRVSQVSPTAMVGRDRNNILTILYNTQDAKCADPRDKLYAILGIVGDADDIHIDYSIPVQVVYRNWTTKRIWRTKSLDILNACANDPGRSDDLPSWVPDLRWPWARDKPLWVEVDRMHASKPVPMSESSYKALFLSEDGLELHVKGVRVKVISSLSEVGDVINGLGNPPDTNASMLKVIQSWNEWFDGHTLEDCSDSKWTPSMNFSFAVSDALLRWIRHSDDTNKLRFIEWLNIVVERTRLSVHFNPHDQVPQTEEELAYEDFQRWLFPRIHGCQLFKTHEKFYGRTGIVAGNCRTLVGDEIWLLDGASTPIVLRRKNGGHQVIGPCYLLDYMENIQFEGSYGLALRSERMILI